ncbi:MAG: PQQ-binding-like beta-propeller repeat protein [Methanomicrobiales archaeon]|nr:PQQ-binding-like beta-propeller repeat protein [Methanomicrobiales archaeon]
MYLHGFAVIGIVLGILLVAPVPAAGDPLWVAHAVGTEIPLGIAVSPNGQYVAVGGDRIAVYSREGEKIWGGFQAKKLVFSPQGAYLIAATDGGVRYLLPDGRSIWNDDERVPCTDIAVSREGDYVAAATGKGAALYDSAGEVLGSNATIQPFSVGVSRDGTLVSIGTKDRIALANRSMEPLWEYSLYGSVSEIFFSSSPPLILASADNGLFALHPGGTLLWQFLARDTIGDFAASADAQDIVVGSRDGSVYLLDNSGQKIWEKQTGDWVTHVDISQDGLFIAAGGNARRILLYTRNGTTLMDIPVNGWVRGIALSPEGGFLGATVDDGSTYLFTTAPAVSPTPSIQPSPSGTAPAPVTTPSPQQTTVQETPTVTTPPVVTTVPKTTPRAGSYAAVLAPIIGAAFIARIWRRF